jgi:hypothetical protein
MIRARTPAYEKSAGNLPYTYPDAHAGPSVTTGTVQRPPPTAEPPDYEAEED